MYINIAKIDFGKCYRGESPGPVEEYYGMYITPADASAISVTPNGRYLSLHDNKYLKYSFDGKKWNDWNGSVTIEPGQKMYLKGEDYYVWSNTTRGKLITSDGYYNVGGDISSLTNEIADVSEYTFHELFLNDNYIKDAASLILPDGTLTSNCYHSMFQGCTSLTTAPELPATELADECYRDMFNGCTSLTTAPELPATSLASQCYSGMFQDCTSLTTAPELPATTLAANCYIAMFQGCTSFTTAPVLPATTLVFGCYQTMFWGCTSLTTAPALPATTLADYCYNGMFSGCTSLITAPSLPATTLADHCYYNMFKYCTSLETAPVLPATTLADSCYYSMFNGCTSLTTAPELHATTLAYFCYASMFTRCSKLNNITMLATDISASGCLEQWVYNVSSTGTFTKSPEMTSLRTGPNGIPKGWTVKDYGVVDYSSEYVTLSALGDGDITINIPAEVNSSIATSLSYSKDKSTWNETLIDDNKQTISVPVTSGENVYLKGIANTLGNRSANVNINSTANINASGNIMSLLYGDDYKDKVAYQQGSEYTFMSLFKDNTHLINAENLILPASTLASCCYESMFYGCTSLTTAPELHATTLSGNCYRYMFQGCSSLTTAPELPATTLTNYCYDNMFNGCTSLTTAPELPATTLASGCYSFMFQGCTSLTTAPVLPATTLTFSCYSNMFYGCSKLNNITMLATDISASGCLLVWAYGVSSTGTFTKASEMTSLPTGENGIPEGWTVVDYGAGGGDYSSEYMTLSALGDGEITITIPAAINSTYATSLSYSKDKATWTDTIIDDTEQTISIPVTSGDNIYLKGIAKQLGDRNTAVNINSSADIDASGNIMSLLYGDNFADKTSFTEESNNTFKQLFNKNAHLISAENLILPATTLVNYCYSNMFRNCTSLTTPPELPATTLVDYCYVYMFSECASLTTAPELPATTLATRCYQSMFKNCSSLTTAPVLPATTLTTECYLNIFYKCTSLNNITMLATDISASRCLNNWVSGVSSTGTFTKSPEMTSLPTGTSGIPDGWTVVDYGAA